MGTKHIGTFKPKIAEELRALFKKEGVRASFIKRGLRKEMFAVFSSDRRAEGILKDYAERRKAVAQLQMPFTDKPNFAR